MQFGECLLWLAAVFSPFLVQLVFMKPLQVPDNVPNTGHRGEQDLVSLPVGAAWRPQVRSGTSVITVCSFRKPLQGPFLPSNDYHLMNTYYTLCVWSLISMPNNSLTRRQDTAVIC